MEQPRKKNKYNKAYIYCSIILISLILNLPLLYITGDFVSYIVQYLSGYFRILNVQPFVIFSRKAFAELLVLNMFILITIEFIIIYIFRKKLNKIFKIDNLFTTNKLITLLILILCIQLIISFGLWTI
jgi:hypothetical protein